MDDGFGQARSVPPFAALTLALAMAFLGANCVTAKTGPNLELDPSVRVPVALLQDYSEFRKEVGCWIRRGEHRSLEGVFEVEECTRLSWEATVSASKHSSCSRNEDCRVAQSLGPVGPELISVQHEWVRADSQTLAAVEKACGTFDAGAPGRGPWDVLLSFSR